MTYLLMKEELRIILNQIIFNIISGIYFANYQFHILPHIDDWL